MQWSYIKSAKVVKLDKEKQELTLEVVLDASLLLADVKKDVVCLIDEIKGVVENIVDNAERKKTSGYREYQHYLESRR